MLEKQIKLLIVDDHTIIRDGLVKLLQDEKNIDIVQVCNNGKSALNYLENYEADVIISDISMPEMDGLELTEAVTKQFKHLNVLLLSMHEEEEYILAAVDKGALGYVTKDVKKAELIEAIKSVANGKKHYSSSILGTMVTGYAKRSRKPKAEKNQSSALTDREMNILKLIADGLSNKEIGLELNISKRTVDTHRTNIMRKLDAKNTAMIVRIAIEANLL